jgi:dipeptidyl-peptidase 4
VSSYPLMLGRTQGFSLGRPLRFTISPDGTRLLFLRTRGGEDPVRCLWTYDVATGEERLLVDPLTLGDDDGPMSDQERIRRERARDKSSGIADYTTDASVRKAAFRLAGRLFVVDVTTGQTRESATGVDDPRLSPAGTEVAYVSGGALRVAGAEDRVLAEPEGPDVTYGLAEHEAAESMLRRRGFWWSPDGSRLAVARVDNSPVRTWYLTDPSRPDAPPITLRYPYAGTPNAEVSLSIIGLDGSRTPVDWDWPDYEYLVDVCWDATALLAVLQNRAQTVMRTVEIDPRTGRATVVREDTDDAWTQIVGGLPAHTAGGALIGTADRGETRHLTVDGEPVTPDGLQVFEVAGVDGDTVVFLASDEPTERHVWTWSAAAGLRKKTTEPGWYDGQQTGGTVVVTGATLEDEVATVVQSHAATSAVTPKVELMKSGELAVRTAVLFPTGHVPGSARLPVLMDPYGGPAGQRAIAARPAYYASQWLADQGFAVVIADGRGTPGRGPRWERTIHRDRSALLLDDQVDALHAVAERYPDLDLDRVGIRGWSAGGYLAALAVLRRPDVFHAAVAGAPVTDHMLYSTHWQERFLGDPRVDISPYERSSLIADAPKLRRPLLLIHGMLDDNVHPVHTMRLSAALFAAGRPHSVLPLPGASHMTAQVETTANVLVATARFLLDELG